MKKPTMTATKINERELAIIERYATSDKQFTKEDVKRCVRYNPHDLYTDWSKKK